MARFGFTTCFGDLLHGYVANRHQVIHHDQLTRREQLPDSSTWTDEKVFSAVGSAQYLEDPNHSIVQVSEDTVVKLSSDTAEALAMDLVRKQTQIATPYMRRIIPHIHSEGYALIVMDFVPNSQQLGVAWPSLSLWRKLKVILTIRLYLRQLRRIQYPPSANQPGPLGPKPSRCDGLQFGLDPKGPFPTISALEAYFRQEHKNALYRASRSWAPHPSCEPLDSSAFTSLVFTHNDLNMRNLLLDSNDVLWMIDFGFSGFYPPWFEYLGMRFASQKDEDPESWQKCIKYMAEPAVEIEEWVKKIGYDYTNPKKPRVAR